MHLLFAPSFRRAQLAITFELNSSSTTPARAQELHHALDLLDRIIKIFSGSQGSGTVLRILGVKLDQRFANVLMGVVFSLLSTGVTKLLTL